MDFLSVKPKAFGLDLSDLSLKVVQLTKRGRFFELSAAGTFPVPPKVIEAGEVKDEKALRGILREGISRVRELHTRYVVCSLPEEQAFLRVIQMPRMAPGELTKAISFETENYIPLPIKDVYLDFQILPLLERIPDDHVDVLIIAVPKRVVEPYIDCLKGAGLRPIVLEVESFAVSRALVRGGAEIPLLLLDFGATRTGFSIFSGTSLRFTASIPVSARNFSDAIAKQLRIEPSQAEEMKRTYGLGERRKRAGREVFEALIPVLIDLAEQIKKYLEYYRTHASHEYFIPRGTGVGRVYLCGGGANLKGLPSFLVSELKVPVELGNPWVNILPDPLKEVPKISHEDSLAYTTALGLALRGIQESS